MKTYMIAFVALALTTRVALAWDGVNVDSGAQVSLDDGSTVAVGAALQLIDTDSGQPLDVTVVSIGQTDEAIQIVVIDNTSGQNQTYDFDPTTMPSGVDLPEPQ
ncbi:MAG: DUF5334 family protein [Alphaproteobacteria bacterium]|nr:DUF5334 family protein [Alphaproteobacteria bacterium]